MYSEQEKTTIINNLKTDIKIKTFFVNTSSYQELSSYVSDKNIFDYQNLRFFLFDYFHEHYFLKEDFSDVFQNFNNILKYQDCFSFNNPSHTSTPIDTKHGIFNKYKILKKSNIYKTNHFFQFLNLTIKGNAAKKLQFLSSVLFIGEQALDPNHQLASAEDYLSFKKSILSSSLFHIINAQQNSSLNYLEGYPSHKQLILNDVPLFHQKHECIIYQNIKSIINHKNYEFVSPLINASSLYQNGFFFLSDDSLSKQEKDKLIKYTYNVFDSHLKSRIYNPFLNTLFNLVNNLFFEHPAINLSGSILAPKSFKMSNEQKNQILNDYIGYPLVKEMINDEINKLVKTNDFNNTDTAKNYFHTKYLSQAAFDFYKNNIPNLEKIFAISENKEIEHKSFLYSKFINIFDIEKLDILNNSMALFGFLNQGDFINIKTYFENHFETFYKLMNEHELGSIIKALNFDSLNSLNTEFVFDNLINTHPNNGFKSSNTIFESNIKKIKLLYASKQNEIHAYLLNQQIENLDVTDKKTSSIKKKI